MSNTPNTGIPYVPEDTTDPAAGLNLALNVIDALLQTAVINMDQTAPPGSPTDGDLHIVAAGATGAWAGQDNNLARYVAEGTFWQFYVAGTNVHFVLNKADDGLYKWGGAAWALAAGLSDAPSDGATYGRKDGVWATIPGGGDVSGPAGATNERIAVFNGATGKLIKDGGKTIAEAIAGRNVVTNVSSSAGTLTLDAALGDYFKSTLTENVTVAISNALPACTLGLWLTQDTTARTVTWPASFNWGEGVSAPAMPTASGAVLFVVATTNDAGGTYDASARVRA